MFSTALSRALLAGVDQEEIDIADKMSALTEDTTGMEEITWALAEDDDKPLEQALVNLYQASNEGLYDAAVALRQLIYRTAVKLAEHAVAA